MEPGKLIDQLYVARAERLKLEKQVEDAKAVETAIRNLIMAELPKLGLDAASGKLATASLKTILMPQIMDAGAGWPKLYAYIQKHGTFEMLHKRLSSEPFQERWAAGQTVPGVSAVEVPKLNLTARKK